MTKSGQTEAQQRFYKLTNREAKKNKNNRSQQKRWEYVDIWEAAHLQDYIRKTAAEENESNLYSRLSKAPISIKTSHDINRLTSEAVQNDKKHPAIFSVLAAVKEVSLHECFYDFLAFCNEKEWLLSAFNDNRKDLSKALKKYQPYLAYLENQRIKTTPDSLKSFPTHIEIKWEPAIYDGEEASCLIEPSFTGHHLRIPDTQDMIDLEHPSTVLTWSSNLTGLVGRESEKEKFLKWLKADDDETNKSILLIHGQGGVGKTKLAFELAELAEKQGRWTAGETGKNLSGNWLVGEDGILIIIDYPEEKPKRLSDFLRALNDFDTSRLSGAAKIRVILLSRNEHLASDVREQAPSLLNQIIHLTPLKQEENESWELFEKAWDAIQQQRIKTIGDGQFNFQKQPLELSSIDFEKWLSSTSFSTTPLMVIALAYYLYCEPNEIQINLESLTDANIIRYMTERECKFIKKEVFGYYQIKKF